MSELKGNNDGPGGRNESYVDKKTKKTISRVEAIKRVKSGKYPKSTVTKINGREYVKDKPDKSKKDNVNYRKNSKKKK